MDDAQFSNVGTEMVPELVPMLKLKGNDTTCKPVNSMLKQTVQERIAEKILMTYVLENDDIGHASTVTYGPLEINQFSICFPLSAMFGDSYRSFYVKIPKWDMYKRTDRTIMPLTQADKLFAADEYRSLKIMETEWEGSDLDVTFAKPVCFIEEYNAIVTERFFGADFFKQYRWNDIRRKAGIRVRGKDPVHSAMGRIGRALARFHKKSATPATFSSCDFIEKIKHYRNLLESHGRHYPLLDKVEKKIYKTNDIQADVYTGTTFKGIDIRNILIDPKNGRLCLLDPGKLKRNFLEADLARFILTCRILYWGSYAFFMHLTPHISYENQFVDAFYEGRKGNQKLRSLFIIKEYLKHWVMAYNVITLKKWPAVMKRLVASTYLNPFYHGSIQKELVNLE